MAKIGKKYQFVRWFPAWGGLWFHKFDPAVTEMARVYSWRLMLGFLEIRKWAKEMLVLTAAQSAEEAMKEDEE